MKKPKTPLPRSEQIARISSKSTSFEMLLRRERVAARASPAVTMFGWKIFFTKIKFFTQKVFLFSVIQNDAFPARGRLILIKTLKFNKETLDL